MPAGVRADAIACLLLHTNVSSSAFPACNRVQKGCIRFGSWDVTCFPQMDEVFVDLVEVLHEGAADDWYELSGLVPQMILVALLDFPLILFTGIKDFVVHWGSRMRGYCHFGQKKVNQHFEPGDLQLAFWYSILIKEASLVSPSQTTELETRSSQCQRLRIGTPNGRAPSFSCECGVLHLHRYRSLCVRGLRISQLPHVL
jgi:hypothetical protein